MLLYDVIYDECYNEMTESGSVSISLQRYEGIKDRIGFGCSREYLKRDENGRAYTHKETHTVVMDLDVVCKALEDYDGSKYLHIEDWCEKIIFRISDDRIYELGFPKASVPCHLYIDTFLDKIHEFMATKEDE